MIRLANERQATPPEGRTLLATLRSHFGPGGAHPVNLRVTPSALEFDLFCPPDRPEETLKAVAQQIAPLLTCRRLDGPPPAQVGAAEIVAEARQYFNEARYWEVHEALEGLWKELRGPEKGWVQALIIAAAALVHVQRHEPDVVWTMLVDARRRLENAPPAYHGWALDAFRAWLDEIIFRREITTITV